MDSFFSEQAGEWFCEAVPLASIAERFGTPTYVYSQAAILGQFRRLQGALEGVSALICYSVKANSNLCILRLLRDAGAGFDIVSAGELARLERIGADPRQVVFSGVGKTAAEIDAALAAGILIFNVESAEELGLIEARARHLDRPAGISLRINPDVEAATHPYIATGRAIHKFGVPPEEALALCRRAAASPLLRLRGLACHIGSQILQVDPFARALDEMLELAASLRAEGLELDYLDLGGGYGIRYRREEPFDFARLAAHLRRRLEGSRYRLIVEPGRALVGEAGVLLARVLYVKRNPAKRFIVVDAGMSDLLRPALYGSQHEVVPVRRRAGPAHRADVVGPICETADFLAQDRELPELAGGDLVAILTAGAYGYSLASNYNSRPRPAEVLVDGRTARPIRRRETVEDLLATEEDQIGGDAPR
jgi:diaminopimelate decarboxylase